MSGSSFYAIHFTGGEDLPSLHDHSLTGPQAGELMSSTTLDDELWDNSLYLYKGSWRSAVSGSKAREDAASFH